MTLTAETLRQKLSEDHSSGAAELALRTLADLALYLRQNPNTEAAQLNDLAESIKTLRPSMAPLTNAMTRWQTAMPGQTPKEALEQVRQDLASAGERLVQNALNLVRPGDRLLLHSRSSAVVGLLNALVEKQVPFEVIATQSSPGCEGYQLAEELNRLGVPTQVITDAQLGLFMASADLTLSGCDTWLAGGHFVNKAGTYLQALAARDRGIPFWVLADSFKNSNQTSGNMMLEEMDSEELGAPRGTFIRPRNFYFETIPCRLITGRLDELSVYNTAS